MLIKVAATWEDSRCRAARRKGIHTNLTLLFSFCQAVACGPGQGATDQPLRRAHLRLVQEVGRCQLGGGRQRGRQRPRREVRHPRSTTTTKKFGIATEVMGASFRNLGQITALAGCDLLTISPSCWPDSPPAKRRCPGNSAPRQLHGPLPLGRCSLTRWPSVCLERRRHGHRKAGRGHRAFCVDAVKLDQLLLAA